MLFDLSLLGLFGSATYSSLNDLMRSLDSYSCYFGLFITLLVGSFVPFISSWASLAHLLSLGILGPFSNSVFPWAFANFFGLHWPNYFILHSWSSWAFSSTPYFLYLHYFRLAWPILTFLYHILPMGLLLLSPSSFRPVCFLKIHLFILWTYNSLFLPLRLNGFLSTH